MKLYLSGGGSGRQNLFAYNSYFNSIDKSKPILYVPLAMVTEEYDDCYEWFKSEIGNFGVTNFEMIKSSKELSEKDLSKYNSIFIGGGNTYKLLQELQKNSNMKKIRNYLKNDGIIYGGSAGAIIFGKDIDCCRLVDSKLEGDTKGFDYLNGYSLLCHLSKSYLKLNEKYLKEYCKENKVLFLPEEDVLLITDKNIKFIGDKKYCLFYKGDYAIHSSANFKKDINCE